MRGLVVVALLASAGCITDHLEVCPGTNLACPEGFVCNDQHGCLSGDQLLVCIGKAEGEACTSGNTVGGCLGGVCLPLGCGNFVMEPGEMCDDGNTVGGDGCSADCTSNETCGNALLDPGEGCDDANRLSHDGCDSQCTVETPTWSVAPLAPNTPPTTAAIGAYDQVRHVFVQPEVGGVWEFDGTRWAVVPLLGDRMPIAMYWDAKQQHVGAIFESDLTSSREVWTGSIWQVINASGPNLLPFGEFHAAFDAVHETAVLFGNGSSATRAWLIPDVGTWIEDILPKLLTNVSAGYDPGQTEVVLIGDGARTGHPINVCSPNSAGLAYTCSGTAAMTPNVGNTADVDLVTIGQQLLAHDAVGPFYRRQGAAWLSTNLQEFASSADMNFFIVDPDLPTAQPRFLGAHVVADLVSGSWHGVSRPSTAVRFSASPTGFLAYEVPPMEGKLRTWPHDPLDDSFETSTSACGGLLGTAHCAWSSGRQTLVCTSQNNLRSVPTCLSIGFGFGGPPVAVTDVPSLRQLHVLYPGGVSVTTVADADNVANQLNYIAQPDATSIAWDPATARDAVAGTQLAVLEYETDEWTPLDAATAHPPIVATDERRGHLLLVDSVTGAVVERTQGAWVPLPLPPIAGPVLDVAYSGARGELIVVVQANGGVYELRLAYRGAAPEETCIAGIDADGDGLTLCDDPDCYPVCSRCPPHQTCPAAP